MGKSSRYFQIFPDESIKQTYQVFPLPHLDVAEKESADLPQGSSLKGESNPTVD